MGIFKKGLVKDIPKYFSTLTPHADNLLVGQFTLRDLADEYVLAMVINDEMKMKVVLCGNNYQNFDMVLGSLKFLLSS